MAALYCSTPGDFDAFEARTRAFLKTGLVRPSIRKAATTLEALKAMAAFAPMLLDRTAAAIVGLAVQRRWRSARLERWRRESPLRRYASRTTILERTLDDVLGGAGLTDLRRDRPALVVVACELRAKAAFYFTAGGVHCWRYGRAEASGLSLAHAVAASAAYPLALPAMDEIMTFSKDGEEGRHRVALTDGGVYDNLGLAPFWPGRDPAISMPVAPFGRLIACRAGYGLDVGDPASFLPSRLKAAFEGVHARAENGAVNRLFDLRLSGQVGHVLLSYLGQDDARLRLPPSDLVRREDVAGYPTNFAAMRPDWIERLVARGEQVTLALLAEHWTTADQTTSTQATAA